MTRSARAALAKANAAEFGYGQLSEADRILSRLSEEGWVVVPKIPTQAMFEAALIAGEEWSDSYEQEIERRWTAMLAAIDGPETQKNPATP